VLGKEVGWERYDGAAPLWKSLRAFVLSLMCVCIAIAVGRFSMLLVALQATAERVIAPQAVPAGIAYCLHRFGTSVRCIYL